MRAALPTIIVLVSLAGGTARATPVTMLGPRTGIRSTTVVQPKTLRPTTSVLPLSGPASQVQSRSRPAVLRRVKDRQSRAFRLPALTRTSTISLLRAALEPGSRKTTIRPRIRPSDRRGSAPRTRAVRPSLLRTLQYQMDLVQMSEALRH